eukprot:CAMPEP_0197527540 /NCGR_PEP_ID=MMETSP1318-20131121/22067_1 /TAXON_ID=552666 /ORGANISM="Partenskyella glossopodia, Strain RCC365" /LENGTH=436 /DNA_ID=CAMNT_0043082253 /DNA_START=353 /DNA_END=1663 /DNA_ORIENTATION=+
MTFDTVEVFGDNLVGIDSKSGGRGPTQKILLMRSRDGTIYVDKHGSFVTKWRTEEGFIVINNALGFLVRYTKEQLGNTPIRHEPSSANHNTSSYHKWNRGAMSSMSLMDSSYLRVCREEEEERMAVSEPTPQKTQEEGRDGIVVESVKVDTKNGGKKQQPQKSGSGSSTASNKNNRNRRARSSTDKDHNPLAAVALKSPFSQHTHSGNNSGHSGNSGNTSRGNSGKRKGKGSGRASFAEMLNMMRSPNRAQAKAAAAAARTASASPAKGKGGGGVGGLGSPHNRKSPLLKGSGDAGSSLVGGGRGGGEDEGEQEGQSQSQSQNQRQSQTGGQNSVNNAATRVVTMSAAGDDNKLRDRIPVSADDSKNSATGSKQEQSLGNNLDNNSKSFKGASVSAVEQGSIASLRVSTGTLDSIPKLNQSSVEDGSAVETTAASS